MDDTLTKFKEVVDEEIKSYESMENFYVLKQSLLVKGESDALWDLDAQILAEADNIRELSKKRKEISKILGDENLSMSEIIEKAQDSNKSIVGSLETQRDKLRELAKSLALKEETNLTLIKHGLTMVEKTLDIFLETCLPQSKQYNKLGQNIENDKSSISSIVEEA